jgi:catechol 2,3-dioxygenase-like lactoylglutathione lyase family enzyme
MIIAAHTVIFSRNAAADRAFFRTVLGFPAVEGGDDYPIFALPPAEAAVHPLDGGPEKHELYLVCDDVKAEIARLAAKGVACGPVSDEGWGLLTTVRLPGGGTIGLYEPRHALAHATKRAKTRPAARAVARKGKLPRTRSTAGTTRSRRR